MEENKEPKEKKQMKISLWTFYVLVAALIILLAATVSGWVLVAKQNQAQKIQNNPPPAITQQK